MTGTAGLQPRRARRGGGSDRDFAYDVQNPWPQPTFVPLTAPGVAVLDSFNFGANQQMGVRPGWAGNARINNGDQDWRTDAVPTFADATFLPTFSHSNVWGSAFGPDSEAGFTFAAVAGTIGIQLVVGGSNLSGVGFGAGYYTMEINTVTGALKLTRSGANDITGSTTVAVPAAGDSFALQNEGPYIYGWRKPSGGSWTLILAAVDTNFTSQYRFVAIGQAANGTNTLDQFWGGSFFSATLGMRTQSVRMVWAQH